MGRRRRRSGYKFTEKTQSKKGIFALLLALVSIAIFVVVTMNSFQHRGEGSMYLGSAGVTSMLIGIISFVLALGSLREENSYKLFPYLATICSFLITGVWIALYVIGFMGGSL